MTAFFLLVLLLLLVAAAAVIGMRAELRRNDNELLQHIEFERREKVVYRVGVAILGICLGILSYMALGV